MNELRKPPLRGLRASHSFIDDYSRVRVDDLVLTEEQAKEFCKGKDNKSSKPFEEFVEALEKYADMLVATED